jgi:hypothetical protein
MTYFVDPYKKYYESLKDASGMTGKVSTITSTITTLSTNSKNISNKISSSTWKEIGATEVTNKILPGLTALLKKLDTDVETTLSKAVDKALKTIYPKTESLKEKDERFETLQTEIETYRKTAPRQFNLMSQETSEYKTWSSVLSGKIEEKNKLEEECKKLQEEIKAAANEINSLEVTKAEDTKISLGGKEGPYVTDGTFIKLNYSGSTFNVINTQNISVTDFVQYINSYRLYQAQQPKYDDACLGVAKAYGKKLYLNTKLQTNMDDFYGGAYLQWDNGISSENKDDILRLIYNELIQGKPSVLMVTTKKGTRHFATVVGMKDTVTCAEDLKEEDLLIIDSWDGKLEAMDNSETGDRHMHKQNGKYRVDRLQA